MTQSSDARGKTNLLRWVRILGTLVCIGFIALQFDLSEVGRMLARPRWPFVLLCISVAPFLHLISVWRWHLLLQARGSDYSYGSLLRIYTIGVFFNQLAPSIVAGDLFRIYQTSNQALPRHAAAAAVIVDRLTGLLIVIVSAFAVCIFLGRDEPRWLAIGGGLAVGTGVLLWIVVGADFGRLRRVGGGLLLGKILTGLASWHASVQEYRNHLGALVAALVLSCFLTVFAGVNFWFAALSFQPGIEAGPVFFSVPAILLLSSLPISVGGWGLQEASTAAMFHLTGLDPALGLSAALLIRVKQVVIALVGGLLYLLLPGKP